MKKKLTIKQMVKEILFDATNGKRTADNYLEGMTVIDSMQYFYYRTYFEDVFERWTNGEISSKSIFLNWYEHLKFYGRHNTRAAETAACLKKLLYGPNGIF